MPVIQSRAGSHAAPQQHKQPSRKGRKAWRKNVDVSEIEQGLEERNSDLIKGGAVADQTSEELFQIEDEGDLNVAKKLAKKYTKGLKADEIIAQRSAVPGVSGRKRAGDNKAALASSNPDGDGGKTTDGVLPAKRQRTNYVTYKELVRLKKVADGHHASTVAIDDADYDPWAVKPKVPSTLRQSPISLAANGKPIPAVAKPKGAFSYNPSFDEYATRLEKEGNKAVEAEKKRLADEEAERVRMEAVARSAAEAEAAEARAELSEWDEDSAWEGFESTVENVDGNGDGDNADNKAVSVQELLARRPKRKTPAQRNRFKRRKAAEAQERHEAMNRRKQEQAQNMEKVIAEAKEAAAHAKQLRRLAKSKSRARATGDERSDDSDQSDQSDADAGSEGDDETLRRRQLGKFKLPDKDLELVLPDELQDSLRLLKPEGNLLKDRYRSILVRGKVEARRKRPFHKQAKAKITEKWAHKDFQLF